MSKILIIEDDESHQRILQIRLRREGYQVLSATDGTDGLEVFTAEQPDLVIMDISLPGMNGWEATRAIRALPSVTPIIALTAGVTLEGQQKALAVGCDEYETKPIQFDTLIPKIRALLTN